MKKRVDELTFWGNKDQWTAQLCRPCKDSYMDKSDSKMLSQVLLDPFHLKLDHKMLIVMLLISLRSHKILSISCDILLMYDQFFFQNLLNVKIRRYTTFCWIILLYSKRRTLQDCFLHKEIWLIYISKCCFLFLNLLNSIRSKVLLHKWLTWIVFGLILTNKLWLLQVIFIIVEYSTTNTHNREVLSGNIYIRKNLGICIIVMCTVNIFSINT